MKSGAKTLLLIFALCRESCDGCIFRTQLHYTTKISIKGFRLDSTSFKKGEFYDGHVPYKTQRNKTLNCSCGIVRDNGDRNASLNFPWNVIISHSSAPPSLRHLSEKKTNVNEPNHCRGTIINSKIVLTSVKCILKLSTAELFDQMPKPVLFPEQCVHNPQDLRVWSEKELLSTDESVSVNKGREITRVYYHPQYLPSRTVYGKLDYDIALLTLREPIRFNNITNILPVCLPARPLSYEELVGHEVAVRGAFGTISLESFIFPRMRCRINSGRIWMSDRFLCTLAPSLKDSRHITAGSAVIMQNGDVFTQYGIHSWKTYYPLLVRKKALTFSTNVARFIEKIEAYSVEMGAEWCINDWNGLPSTRDINYNETFVNEPETLVDELPWYRITLPGRDIRHSCRCGRVNSLTSLGRIQGGVDAVPYEYGWMVQLISRRKGTSQLCGGSIISDRIVITAAHCVFKSHSDMPIDLIPPEDLEVHVARYKGIFLKDERSFLATVETVIPHPLYNLNLVQNDIALVVLSKPLDFKQLKGKVSPICFPEANETLNIDGRNDAMIIGWGRTQALKEKTQSVNLQELQVKAISNSECVSIFKKYGSSVFQRLISDGKRICAGNFRSVKDYKDPAQGDSGGPLFIPIQSGLKIMVQIGIASLVTMTALAEDSLEEDLETVTIYTRTQSYIDFVEYYSLIAEATWCSR